MNQLSNKKRGFATAGAMIAVMTCFLALGALMMAASTQLNMTSRSLSQTRATLLAEAGVESAVTALVANWNANAGSGTLFEDPGTNTVSAGTFSYTVSVVSSSRRKITSTGVDTSGRTVRVVALAEYISDESISLSRYALLSHTYIGFGGNSNIRTNPLNAHNADARTNGYISQGGSSVVDGTLIAMGTVAGSGYYPNQTGASEILFPDSDQLTTWEASWRAQAQGGTTYTANSVPTTITAPAYINGNVSLTGQRRLTITGTGIVFIEGSLSMNAQTIVTNSATLVVRDSIRCNGQSLYQIPADRIAPATGWTGTLVNLYGDVALNGGGTGTGIVYCARGNMTVNGGALYNGSLIAGGSISTIGTYDQVYDGNMRTNISFPVPVRVLKVIEP